MSPFEFEHEHKHEETAATEPEVEFDRAGAAAEGPAPVSSLPFGQTEEERYTVKPGSTNVAYTENAAYAEPESYGEPDEASFRRASALADQLMDEVKLLSREMPPARVFNEVLSATRYAEHAETAPISDVVETVAQMAHEFASARRLELPILCLETENALIPVSTAAVSGGPGSMVNLLRRGDPSVVRDLLNEAIHSYAEQNRQLTTVNVDEAEESAHFNLRIFLNFRFWGSKNWRDQSQDDFYGSRPPVTQIPPEPGDGLHVRVFSRTRGLRIQVAPAFYVDQWLFFGHPSTPVSGPILPGRHVFAGDGPMLPRRTVDPVIFATPPTFDIKLTRF